MTDLPATSHSLLNRLRERSDDAWADFLCIYGRALRAYCRSKGLQDADADDVFAEVVSALEAALTESRFDPKKGTLRGWLFRVARNLAVDKFRKREGEIVGAADSHLTALFVNKPASIEEECTAVWMEYRSQLFHFAAEQVRPVVSPTTWDAFWRTAVKGERSEHVARSLGTTTGSVYAAKCRVIARIRSCIDSLDDHSIH